MLLVKYKVGTLTIDYTTPSAVIQILTFASCCHVPAEFTPLAQINK